MINLNLVLKTQNETDKETTYLLQYNGQKYILTVKHDGEFHNKLYECNKEIPSELESFLQKVLSDDLNNYDDVTVESFEKFLKKIGKDDQVPYAESIIVCDSDKCEQYKNIWKQNGIPYSHGVMMYLITKMNPYNGVARVTITPCDFVIKYYPDFKKYFED